MVPVANRLDLRAALDTTSGTVTDFLEQLVGEKVDAHSHHHDMVDADTANGLHAEQGEPLLRPRRLFGVARPGRSYVYAESVIVVGRLPTGFCDQLETSTDPIGRILNEMEIPFTREEINERGGFVVPRPRRVAEVHDCLLTRTYRIDFEQTPVMIITEWFLTTLVHFLSSA